MRLIRNCRLVSIENELGSEIVSRRILATYVLRETERYGEDVFFVCHSCRGITISAPPLADEKTNCDTRRVWYQIT